MIIGSETLQILKNFSLINSNMLFREGSTLSTINAESSILARASISEHIDRQFAIYDLNSLLQLLTFSNILSVLTEPDSLIIKTEVGEFQYFYCDPSLLKNTPPDESKEISGDPIFEFSVNAQDIQTISKTISILNAPSLLFSGDSSDGEVRLTIGDKKNLTANNFQKSLGHCNKEFSMVMSAQNFLILPDQYRVSVMEQNFFLFESTGKSENKSLRYWIAAERGE